MSEIKVASRKERALALVIDHTLLTLITVFSLMYFMLNEMESRKVFPAFFIWVLIVLVLYLLKDSIKGMSIGKWMMGITVRHENDLHATPGLFPLFLRNLLLIIWPVEIILLVMNENKQRIGDKIARTVVVKVRRLSLWKIFMLIILAVVTFFVLIFSTIFLILKNNDAYETAITYIETSEEVISETGGIEGFGFLPTGSVQISNGYGKSNYSILVRGVEKDMHVKVYLTKEPRQDWIIEEVYYE